MVYQMIEGFNFCLVLTVEFELVLSKKMKISYATKKIKIKIDFFFKI